MDRWTFWDRANEQLGGTRSRNREDASREVMWDKRSKLSKLTVAEKVEDGSTEGENLENRARTKVRNTGWKIRFGMEFLNKVVAWQQDRSRLDHRRRQVGRCRFLRS